MEKIETLMTEIDKNQDGKLELDELHLVVRAWARSQGQYLSQDKVSILLTKGLRLISRGFCRIAALLAEFFTTPSVVACLFALFHGSSELRPRSFLVDASHIRW